jgi:hypothetical protein
MNKFIFSFFTVKKIDNFFNKKKQNKRNYILILILPSVKVKEQLTPLAQVLNYLSFT